MKITFAGHPSITLDAKSIDASEGEQNKEVGSFQLSSLCVIVCELAILAGSCLPFSFSAFSFSASRASLSSVFFFDSSSSLDFFRKNDSEKEDG